MSAPTPTHPSKPSDSKVVTVGQLKPAGTASKAPTQGSGSASTNQTDVQTTPGNSQPSNPLRRTLKAVAAATTLAATPQARSLSKTSTNAQTGATRTQNQSSGTAPSLNRSATQVRADPTGSQKPPSRTNTAESARSQKPPSRTNTMASTTPSAASSPSTPSNPFAANEEFHKYYEKLIKLVRERKPEDKPRVVVYTDIEQDYDDLLTVIFLAEMHRMGAIELAGFVANHHPALERAMFLRTVLHLLNLSHIPVAVGTAGVQGVEEILDKDDKDTKTAKIRKTKEALKAHAPNFYYGLKNRTFRNAPWNKNRASFHSGKDLVDKLASSERPLTVLLISTLQDIGEYFTKTDHNSLRDNFSKFVSQGGYEVTQTNGTVKLAPVADMMNNKFHPTQAANYTNYLANLKLRSDAWSREAAKASRLPGTFMKELFQYGPIGAHLEWMWMRLEFKFYWDPFNWPFMPFLNPGWYLNTRLGMPKGTEQFNELKDTTVPFTYAAPNIKVIAYDCCAAVGVVGDDFMRAMGVLVPENEVPAYNRAAHGHRVFGKEADDLGGVRGPVLKEVMQAFIMGGLRSTYKKAQATPGFQKLQHDKVSYRFGVDSFLNDLLPLLKAEAAHVSKAQQYAQEASKAEKEGKNADSQRLLGLAAEEKKQAAELCQKLLRVSKTNMKNRPTRDDIPYEALYEKAMQSLGQAKRPVGSAGGN